MKGTNPIKPSCVVARIEAPVAIDGWAETIPSRLHSTWAAFGYDAPRARPQQVILLAVPADVDASVGLVLDDDPYRAYRAQIFLNGWNLGWAAWKAGSAV